MQVFKYFFKVSFANISRLIVTISVGLAFIILFSNSQKKESTTEYEYKQYDVALVNNDNSELADGIADYLKSVHNVDTKKYSDEMYTDLMFNNKINVKIEIPEGYGEKVLAGEKAEIICLYDEALPYGLFVNNQVNEYRTIFDKNIKEGKSETEAVAATKTAMDSTNFVEIKQESKDDTEFFKVLFGFLPYLIMLGIFSSVLYAVISFNEKEVKNRTTVSAIKTTERGTALVMGSIVISMCFFVIYVGMMTFLARDYIPSFRAWVLEVVNIFIYTIVCNMVMFLMTAILNKIGDAVTVMANLVTLVCAFLGGSFVPLEYMSDDIKIVGRFTPNYWYNIGIGKICDDPTIGNVMPSYLMQLALGLAIFGMALAVLKVKNDRSIN